MATPGGFSYEARADGSVAISHHGRPAAVLRGVRAERFLEDAAVDAQLAMARWTGNYRRGNERTAKQYPRNR